MAQEQPLNKESQTKHNFRQPLHLALKLGTKITQFYIQNVALITAASVSLLSLLFFVSVSYQEFFTTYFSFFRVRWLGIGILSIIAFFTLLNSFLRNQKKLTFLLIWLESNILTLISFTYLLGIENRNFYPFLISFLTCLILVVNFDLFGKRRYYFYTLVAQALLFSVQGFSWVNLLTASRVDVISFNQDSLSNLLSLPLWLWLAFSALGITLITISSFGLTSFKKISAYTPVLFFLFFQMFLVVESLNFNNFFYWQKTLLFLIFWDFVYIPLRVVTTESRDEKYNPKIVASVAYHAILIVAVFLAPNLNFLYAR